MAGFGDRVIERTRALKHPLCVGLDPYLERIPSLFRRGPMQPQHPDTARAIEQFCCRVIDLIAAEVAVVKPQASLFERLGCHGWRAPERVIRYARAAGLLVLLDAKRGDIAETALAYAQAYVSADSACSVDALTVNPYLGPESLAPFMVEGQKAERGVVVLVRNSNPDSSIYQAVETPDGPLFAVVASLLELAGPPGRRCDWLVVDGRDCCRYSGKGHGADSNRFASRPVSGPRVRRPGRLSARGCARLSPWSSRIGRWHRQLLATNSVSNPIERRARGQLGATGAQCAGNSGKRSLSRSSHRIPGTQVSRGTANE